MTVQPTRDQLRALANAATEGPWEAEYSGEQGNCVLPPNAQSTREAVAVTRLYHQQADAEFIAAARTTLPQLLDQLDAAEQLIRDLTQEVRDERGAARDQMEQVRIRDARIKAVEDVLDTWMTYCQTEQTARALSEIQDALRKS